MPEKVQPGCRVDRDVYERFVQWAKQKSGRERGIAGRELEKAMIDRMNQDKGPDELARIENDVAHIKAMLAEGNDGGEPLPTASDTETTHARSTDKPAANQPRQDKIAYLITCLTEEYDVTRESGQLPTTALRNIAESEYNFDSNILDEYVEGMLEELDAKQHPEMDVQYAWGERYDEIVGGLQVTDTAHAERVE